MKDRSKFASALTITEWEKANKILLENMEEWRKSYVCRNKCIEWKKWKYCKHLVKARVKYFRKQIDESINGLYFLNYGVNFLEKESK